MVTSRVRPVSGSPATSGIRQRVQTVAGPGSLNPPSVNRHSSASPYGERRQAGEESLGLRRRERGCRLARRRSRGCVPARPRAARRAPATASRPFTSARAERSWTRLPGRSTAAVTFISPTSTGPSNSTESRAMRRPGARGEPLQRVGEQRRRRTPVLEAGRPGADGGQRRAEAPLAERLVEGHLHLSPLDGAGRHLVEDAVEPVLGQPREARPGRAAPACRRPASPRTTARRPPDCAGPGPPRSPAPSAGCSARGRPPVGRRRAAGRARCVEGELGGLGPEGVGAGQAASNRSKYSSSESARRISSPFPSAPSRPASWIASRKRASTSPRTPATSTRRSLPSSMAPRIPGRNWCAIPAWAPAPPTAKVSVGGRPSSSSGSGPRKSASSSR